MGLDDTKPLAVREAIGAKSGCTFPANENTVRLIEAIDGHVSVATTARHDRRCGATKHGAIELLHVPLVLFNHRGR